MGDDPRQQAHTVVALRGEYDLARAGEVRDELYAALEDELPIVVDLSGATFIDTVTLGVLLEAVRRSRRSRRELLIYLPESAGRQVHELFRITGVDNVLPVVRERAQPVGRAEDSRAAGRRNLSPRAPR
jgi:anti-anti-sigma factor